MSTRLSRRRFLARSIAVAAAAPVVMSVEEHRLLARTPAPGGAATGPNAPLEALDGQNRERPDQPFDLWRESDQRLRAQSRSDLRVTTAEALSHRSQSDGDVVALRRARDQHDDRLCRRSSLRQHVPEDTRKRGGKIQFLAQINPDPRDLRAAVNGALEADAVGAFLVGNTGDLWAREKAVGRIAEIVGLIKDADIIAGVAGHELRTPRVCEAGKVEPDFYVKTLHDRSYWSKQQPGQDRDVIDNYSIDNYWCQEPENVIGFMSGVARPWIAYKVLAAGAIHPRDGFRYAFQNGADFAAVGMFDFQVSENALVANTVLTDITTRNRAWRA